MMLKRVFTPMVLRVFTPSVLIVWLGAVLGALCVLPYSLAIAPEALDQASQQMGLPIPAIIAISLAQSAVLFLPITIIGFWAAKKLGLGAPLIAAWTNKSPFPKDLRTNIRVAILSGLVVTAIIVFLDKFIFTPALPDLALFAQQSPAIWKGGLASFYGGITEEVLMRLFALSVLALGLRVVWRLINRDDRSNLPLGIFLLANIVTALLFGLAHLPITAELIALTPLVIFRALLLNGIAGIVAGVFFWKRGIEMAMIFHFSADIGLHVLIPMFLS